MSEHGDMQQSNPPTVGTLNQIVITIGGWVSQAWQDLESDLMSDGPSLSENLAALPIIAAPAGELSQEVDAGLSDLAKFRSELGLPAARPGSTTLSRLDIGGDSFYVISGHGQDITFDINAVSATHAEADAFQQAINAGVSWPSATLFIDNLNGLCGYCLNSGLSSMMRASGVNSLTVISPQGTMVFGP